MSIDLTFISKQLEQVLSEQRYIRSDLRVVREDLRLARGQIARIEDAISMDILDRLRALEAVK